MVGSITNIAGIRGLTSSRVAGVGLRRSKALLSSAWNTLSPQGKAPKEALSSLKSGISSAATNLSRKYEEMRESVVQSPAQEPPDEDRVSQTSTDSRRHSEAVQVDGLPQDTWSTLTEALWNHLWGDSARQPSTSQTGLRAADITEQFETLYATAARDSEEEDRNIAVLVTITSC